MGAYREIMRGKVFSASLRWVSLDRESTYSEACTGDIVVTNQSSEGGGTSPEGAQMAVLLGLTVSPMGASRSIPLWRVAVACWRGACRRTSSA